MADKFADNIFKYILWSENFISNKILLKYVPKGFIDDKSALVQVMAWCLAGYKRFPESMLTKMPLAIWPKLATVS